MHLESTIEHLKTPNDINSISIPRFLSFHESLLHSCHQEQQTSPGNLIHIEQTHEASQLKGQEPGTF